MIASFAEDRYLRRVAVIGILATGILVLCYLKPVQKVTGDYAASLVSDLLVVAFALANTLLSGLMWHSFSRGEVLKAVWRYLAVGLLLWAIGETIWAFYELVLRQDSPYPSAADIAWAIAYLPLFAALVLRYRSLRTAPTRQQLAGGLGMSGLLILLVAVFVIRPILTSQHGVGAVEQFLNVLYPVGDSAIVLVALLTVFALSGGMLSRPWLLIAAGFLTVSVSDLLFSYTNWNEQYLVGSNPNFITVLTDVLYFAGYVIITFGLVMQARLQKVL